jgi:hypothetical protein
MVIGDPNDRKLGISGMQNLRDSCFHDCAMTNGTVPSSRFDAENCDQKLCQHSLLLSSEKVTASSPSFSLNLMVPERKDGGS